MIIPACCSEKLKACIAVPDTPLPNDSGGLGFVARRRAGISGHQRRRRVQGTPALPMEAGVIGPIYLSGAFGNFFRK